MEVVDSLDGDGRHWERVVQEDDQQEELGDYFLGQQVGVLNALLAHLQEHVIVLLDSLPLFLFYELAQVVHRPQDLHKAIQPFGPKLVADDHLCAILHLLADFDIDVLGQLEKLVFLGRADDVHDGEGFQHLDHLLARVEGVEEGQKVVEVVGVDRRVFYDVQHYGLGLQAAEDVLVQQGPTEFALE